MIFLENLGKPLYSLTEFCILETLHQYSITQKIRLRFQKTTKQVNS